MSAAVELIKQMHLLRVQKDQMDEDLKEVNKKYDELRSKLVPEAMDAEGITNIKVEGVGRVNLRSDIYCSVKNKDALFTWLRDTGNGDIIQEQVNASTLKAMLRRKIEAGEDLSDLESEEDAVLKITPYTQAIITKA